ncbi:MAG: 16S rRNA (uracil(1498)-N(3))-methyltransferase [Elusimicrobiales bacterium]|nr:16S rRNA (uracil(1498)-N(3))-methyltransferase [Elusimicrobiales bacterium]MCK5356839.1 16S rRNA (uracil(1498)-N(3))-methyltransferase [Elusimicrobiales bacterium]
MSQYFINKNNIKNDKFEADIDESRHIMKVARHRIGDEIKIFDGRGKRYSAVIDLYERQRVSGSIKSEMASCAYKIKLTLCFAPTKKTAVEEILEHCTETGVSSFMPIITSRTQGRENYSDKWIRKKERFKQILLSASKQSERAFIPELSEPKVFKDVFEGADIVFFALPEGDSLENCKVDFKNIKTAKIIIGPEGGFTPEEIAFAKTKKAVFIKISKHILRSETASIAASSLILNNSE